MHAYLYNEEAGPTAATGDEHEGAEDPVVGPRLLGGALVGAAAVVDDVEDGAFVESHHHRSWNCDYCPYHLCNAV